jgi:hypothetical protein
MFMLATEDFMEDVDDLLGPTPRQVIQKYEAKAAKVELDDLLGKAKKKKAPKKVSARKYRPLEAPKVPAPGGIFAAREEKGKNLGRTCLICKVELKHKRGRPPVICRKATCFRAYRNLYRHDYDKVRAA